MPLELQHQPGLDLETVSKPSSRGFRHHDSMPLAKSELLDSREACPLPWESLWVDLGGEG
jgi:hypothetical protein